MTAPIYQMVMHSGPTPGMVFPLEKANMFIGRDLGNDVVINDAEVSRRHARLVMQGDSFVLEEPGLHQRHFGRRGAFDRPAPAESRRYHHAGGEDQPVFRCGADQS